MISIVPDTIDYPEEPQTEARIAVTHGDRITVLLVAPEVPGFDDEIAALLDTVAHDRVVVWWEGNLSKAVVLRDAIDQAIEQATSGNFF